MEHKIGERRIIKVTVPSLGKTLDLRKPKLGEFQAYENALEQSRGSGGSLYKAMVDFLVSMGATEEDARNLDSDEYQEIIGVVTASKKN